VNLFDRYKRLTFWNKLAFWGSVASLVGLAWSFFAYFQTPPGEPVLEISYRAPAGVFIRNIGVGTARNIQFYPALYSITKKGIIHDRYIPPEPSLHLEALDPGNEAEVTRSNYLRISDFSRITYPPSGYQGPFLASVVTYHGSNQKHLMYEVFQFFGPEETLLLPVPLSYSPGVDIKGNLNTLDQTLESIKRDILLAFHR
jgi:hypothetical protein